MGQRKQRISTRTVELGLSFHPCLPPSQMVCRITSLAVGGRKSGVGLACAQGRGPQAWVKNIEILTPEVRQLEAQAGLLASHRLEPRPGLASSLPPCIGAIFCWEIAPQERASLPLLLHPTLPFLSLWSSVESGGRAGKVGLRHLGPHVPHPRGLSTLPSPTPQGGGSSFAQSPDAPSERPCKPQAPPPPRPQPRSWGRNSIVRG